MLNKKIPPMDSTYRTAIGGIYVSGRNYRLKYDF